MRAFYPSTTERVPIVVAERALGAPPHTAKCPENEVSEETNLRASYVVTKSA